MSTLYDKYLSVAHLQLTICMSQKGEREGRKSEKEGAGEGDGEGERRRGRGGRGKGGGRQGWWEREGRKEEEMER